MRNLIQPGQRRVFSRLWQKNWGAGGRCLLAAVLSLLVWTPAWSAQDAVLQAVHDAFIQRFDNIDVVAVRATPFDGLYEVQIGTDLIYTDAQVTYLLDGTLIDAATRRDLTQASMETIAAQTVDKLPLELAIKQVKGDGKRWIAIFEDPHCGYCKQLRRTLEEVNDLTVYSFMFPILSEDSHVKARDIWCAANRTQTLDDWMLRGKSPASAECETPIADILALGQQLMVRGTPAIFFDDGSRASGALPLAALKARLQEP